MISVFDVPVIRGGAVLPLGSGRPWAPTVSGAGHSLVPVQIQIPGSAAVTARMAKAPRAEVAIRQPLTVTGGLPLVDNRKQYMTRVNAGGDGATGPHPEREPA